MPSHLAVASRVSLRLSPALLAAACAALLGCGGGGDGPTTPPQGGTPGLNVVSGAGATDTIEAVQKQPLVVRVVGANGKPLAGRVVTFAPTPIAVPPGTTLPSWISPTTTAVATVEGWSPIGSGVTDAEGRVGALVRMGAVAGPAAIVVTVPELGLTTTAAYTVTPGAAYTLGVSPRDTAVYVGATVALKAAMRDRAGNARDDAVTYELTGDRATLSGATLSATAIGRVRLKARVGAVSDTMGISIVPRGTIAAYTMVMNTGHQLAVYSFGLDGSNFRKVVPSVIGSGYFGEMPPVWSRDGATIFYHDNKTDHTRSLWAVDVATGVSRRLLSAADQFAHEAWPARSPDGQWVYFNGSEFNEATLFRVRTDGTGREQVGPTGAGQRQPSLSPDGTRVAFSSGGTLAVMDLASKQVTSLGLTAGAPAWSPLGDLIAYVSATDYLNSGAIHVVRPDGSGARVVTTGIGYVGRLDWSPDGKYLVAANNGGSLVVIDVATGEEMPVRLTAAGQSFLSPSWKP
jgi:Tol biopolymer transport system component